MEMWDDGCMRKECVRDRLHVWVLSHRIHDDDKPFRSDVATVETVECMESVSSHVPVSAGMVIRPRVWRRKKIYIMWWWCDKTEMGTYLVYLALTVLSILSVIATRCHGSCMVP